MFPGIRISVLASIALLTALLAAGAQTLQPVPARRPAVLSHLSSLGPLDRTQALSLAIALPLRNQAALTQFLREVSDPQSPNYRHYLTPAQFTERFGPTQSDYQAVIAFAEANGLTVTTQYANRLIVDVKGPVPAVERALHVSMLSYQHPAENRKFFAPDAEPSLELAVPISGISGLDNYALPKPRYKILAPSNEPPKSASVKGQTGPLPESASSAPSNGSGPSNGYIGKDFRTAYVPGVTLTGSGQTVGLLQFDGYTASDITYYETKAGLPAVPITNVLLDGFNGAPTGNGGEVEVSLDIEMAMSMAPGLSGIIVYEAGPSGDWHDILNRMCNDNLAKQLSCSWYIPGGTMDAVADGIFQQMAAQGQSFFTASGDYDAFTGLLPFPGDTPYATQVGGTMLNTVSAGGAYSSEQVWNRNNGIGTGGGISTQYAIPSWQQGISMTANLGSTTMRNVPDVAFTAENVYVRADGVDQLVGGTSCAAPLWAGFTALVNQQAIVNTGTTVGFINPAVYAIGQSSSYTTGFHDTTVGNNFSSSSPSKFPGTTGYDLCTGWGTPNGAALINALAPAPIPIIANTNPLPSSSAGVPYNETLSATGGAGGYRFSIIAGNLPAGLTLSSGGTINGTTNVAGSVVNFTVRVTDSAGKSSSTALSINCLAAGTPVIKSISPLSPGSMGVTYNFTFSAAGGTPPYTFSGKSGGYPPGLTLSSTGVLSGTPTATGTYIFSVTVQDHVGASSSAPFTLTITPPPPPIITSPLTATGTVGQLFSYQITASHNPTSFGASPLPAGLSVNSSSGLISGTPTAGGVSNITLSATSSSGTGSATLALTVRQAPAFTNSPISVPVALGLPYSFNLTATGAPAPTFSVTAGALPPGLVLSSAGVIAGTPTQLGTFSGTVTATNSVGSATQNFTFKVVSGLTLGITLPTKVSMDDPDGLGTLSLSAVSSNPTTVTLTSSNTGALTVPVTVTVPANQASVSLPYVIVDNLTVFGTQTTTVTASASGWGSASQLVSVIDNKDTSNWKMFGNGQAHTGVYRGSLLGVTYAQAWSAAFNSGSLALNPVTIDKGVAYVTPISRFGAAALTAVDSNTGAQLWHYVYSTGSSSGTNNTYNSINPPTVYKGNVYVQQGQGLTSGGSGTVPPALWSFNAATGQVNWTAPFGAQWESYLAPTIHQSVGIWVDGGGYGGLYGFNFDGTQRSFTNEPQYDQWTPTLYNGVIYTWVAGTFDAIDPATGSVIWSTTAPYYWQGYDMYCAAPIADNLALLNGTQNLTAVNVATHATAWSISGAFKGTPAMANKFVYIISGSKVLAFNQYTGAAVTMFETGDTGLTGQPVVATDSLVVSSSTATYLFSLTNGALIQTIPYGGPISVANGVLYLAGTDGALRAFQPASPVAPTITSANSTIFSVGQAGSFTVTATGYPAPTFSAVGLPTWATLDPNSGVISGAPASNDGSPFSFTVTASNGTSPDATQNFSITVVQTYAPVITNGPPPLIGAIGSSYAFTWTATGYPFPTFALTAGNLPPGLNLSSSGSLTGFPTTPGTYTGTVTASNGIGTPASQDFSITVQQAPVITSNPLSRPLSLGSAFTFTFTASGAPAPTYAVTNGSLPSGLTLSSAGVITGTPTTVGSYTGTITATNPAGSDSQAFSFNVVSGSALGIILPTTVNEDDPDGSGSIFLSKVVGTATTVQLTSSNTGALTVPVSVVIPAGQASAALPYTVVDNLTVFGTQSTTVTASASGWNGATQLVSVTDNKDTSNWKMFGNGQAHTGVYRGSLLGVTYAQAWSAAFNSGSLALNPVTIDKGVAYVTPISRFGAAALTAVDSNTGAQLWHYVYSTGSSSGTNNTYNSINPPTVYKGNVYVQQGQGLTSGGSGTVPPALWSFNAATGQVNWTAPFGAQWESYLAPTIHQSVGIWVDGGGYGGLYGFNFDGTQRSFTNEPQTDQWTPTFYNGTIYSWVITAGSGSGTFSAVNPSNGAVLWSLAAPATNYTYDMNCAAPIADNLALLNGTQNLTAVNVATHATAWSIAGAFKGTPAMANGKVYVISGSTIEILNESTGALLTTLQTNDTGLTGQPVVAADSLIVSSSTATYLFNSSSGALVQTFPFGGPVSVANGIIYIAGFDGFLHAMKPGSPVPPTITSANATTFNVGLPGGFTIISTGFPAPTYSAAGLPSWATLNSTTGVISGTPPNGTGSPFTVNVTVSNGVNPNAIQSLTITVNPTLYPPSLTDGPPATVARVGVPVNFTYTATGFPSPTFVVSSGAFPPGLNLSSSGVLSGTPNATGVYTGTISADNGVGFPASQSFAITVLPAVSPPVITSGTPPSAIAGNFYTFSCSAVGVPAPTFSSNTLPPGLTLSASGLLSGTPTTPGEYSVALTASNGTAPDATQNFTFIVMASFNTWKQNFFTQQQLQDVSISGPNANPAGDGIPNLLKYLFDLDPRVPAGLADRAMLPKVALVTENSQTYLTLVFRENPLATGLTIYLQTSPDLTAWANVTPDFSRTIGTDPATGDPIVQVGVEVGAAATEFIRLNVTSP